MAYEIRTFDVTVPAGTLASAPQVTDLTMPARIVRQVDIRIPPGPRGEVGFALGAARQAVIPYNPGQWIIGDDEVITWPLEGQIDSGAWQAILYNTGAYPHTLEFRFHLDLTGQDATAGQPPGVVAAQLAQASQLAALSGPVTAQGVPGPLVVTPILAQGSA